MYSLILFIYIIYYMDKRAHCLIFNKDKGYLDRMRNIIDRYTTNNKQLIIDYNNLLDDLISNKFVKRTYNWKTNTVL